MSTRKFKKNHVLVIILKFHSKHFDNSEKNKRNSNSILFSFIKNKTEYKKYFFMISSTFF